MEIKPMESFVLDGLLTRIAQVFRCRTVLTTAQDKTRALEKLFSGKPVEYPYAFVTIQSMSHNKESYHSTTLTRRGVPVARLGNRLVTARILPTNFHVEVEYHTNKFSGIEVSTVMGFTRRWLFAMKCGYLKFNVEYGQLKARIGVTLDDSLQTPPLENKVETESVYKITGNLVVHGYTSEPITDEQGVLEDIELETVFGPAQGYDYIPFTRS